MKKKPLSITIIAWFLIISTVVSGFFFLWGLTISDTNLKEFKLMTESLIPLPLQCTMAFINFSIGIVSGIGILKGYGWARLLFIISGAIGFLINIIILWTEGFRGVYIIYFWILLVTFFVIMIFILYRPASNQYFYKRTGARS